MILVHHVTVVDKRTVRRPRGLWGRGLWACIALVFGALASCTSTSAAGPPVSTTPGIASARPTGAVTSSTGPSTTSSTVAAPPTTTGPPQFFWGYGDPLICGAPTPIETAGAIEAQRRSGPLSLPASVRSQRVLLVGDSTACSLWPGVNAVGNAVGVATYQGAVFGCGIASGQITTTRNESITPHSSRCPALVGWAVPNAMTRARPTVVIWMSIWEKSDLVVAGHTIVANTPRWESEIMARMDGALALLTAGGARVVVVTEAAPAPNPAQRSETTDPKADDSGYVRLNALLRRFRAQHPDQVALVDLATKLCPSGPPCPAVVSGSQPRPDGRHFTPAAATTVARWLFSQIFAAPG
jgi:SGNH domain (fused to AT3 domains)